MKSFPLSLEVLEQRIAPAAVFNYLNAEGGSVKITTSKGVDADLAGVITTVDSGLGKTVQKIDFASHPIFRGTDLLVELTGAGTADVRLIEASGFDLGEVTVPGDLGKITAGDANLVTPSVKLLHIGSLGVQTTTPGPALAFSSYLRGPLLSLEVDHDVIGFLEVQGKLTTARIHGSVIGGAADSSGAFGASGGIDTLVVEGSIVGGEGVNSGQIVGTAFIRSATIAGNITGSNGIGSGFLKSDGDILLLNIGGSLSGEDSASARGDNGRVMARKITTATISGVIDGGYCNFSGSISAFSIGTINALGGLVGGEGEESGAITVATTITKAIVGGSGGSGTVIKGGDGLLSGSIHGRTLGFIEVNGDVQGGAGKVSGGISSVGSTVKVLIHGKLSGGSTDNSGSIGSGGSIGEVEIQQGIFGGGGKLSGSVAAVSKITKATIGVGVNGGGGEFSGTVGSFGNVGTVLVGGSIKGSVGDHSGGILSGSTITSLVIDGSIVGAGGQASGRIESRFLPSVRVGVNLEGGAGPDSGTIFASGSMGTIDVAGSLLGYKAGSPGTPANNNGQILSHGKVSSIHVGGDLRGGLEFGSGSIFAHATIASVVVDGSLIGGDEVFSGSIVTLTPLPGPVALLASLTKVTIGGSIQGGDGDYSGVVSAAGSIGALSVLGTTPPPAGAAVAPGDVFGGNGPSSGSIFSGGNMGTIAIAGNLIGSADGSGRIYSEVSIAKLTIGGSVRAQGYYGVDPDFVITPGQIVAKKILTSLEITGSVMGGAGVSSAEINAGALGRVVIHGSLFGGDGQFSGSVRAFSGDLASLTVDGLISAKGVNEYQYISAQRNIGTITAGAIQGSGAPVLIMATGQFQPKTAAAALAIKSVSTAGFMINTQIVAGLTGTGGNLVLRNPESSIGTVEVGTARDLPEIYQGNDIAAGFTLAGTKAGLKGAVLSKIGSVIIHGTIGQSSVPHFIRGDFISSISAAGVAAPLKAGPQTDYRLPIGANAGGIASVFASERETP